MKSNVSTSMNQDMKLNMNGIELTNITVEEFLNQVGKEKSAQNGFLQLSDNITVSLRETTNSKFLRTTMRDRKQSP